MTCNICDQIFLKSLTLADNMVSEFATGRLGLVYKITLKVIIVGDRFGG